MNNKFVFNLPFISSEQLDDKSFNKIKSMLVEIVENFVKVKTKMAAQYFCQTTNTSHVIYI